MTDILLSVRNLAVRYGDLVGIADVSLEVAAGSIVALLGSNSAGTSTSPVRPPLEFLTIGNRTV